MWWGGSFYEPWTFLDQGCNRCTTVATSWTTMLIALVSTSNTCRWCSLTLSSCWRLIFNCSMTGTRRTTAQQVWFGNSLTSRQQQQQHCVRPATAIDKLSHWSFWRLCRHRTWSHFDGQWEISTNWFINKHRWSGMKGSCRLLGDGNTDVWLGYHDDEEKPMNPNCGCKKLACEFFF